MDGMGEIEISVLDILSEGPITCENMIAMVSDTLQTPRARVAPRVKLALHEGLKIGYIQKEDPNLYSFCDGPKITDIDWLNEPEFNLGGGNEAPKKEPTSSTAAPPSAPAAPSATPAAASRESEMFDEMGPSTSKGIKRPSNNSLDADAPANKQLNEMPKAKESIKQHMDKAVGTRDGEEPTPQQQKIGEILLNLMDSPQAARDRSVRRSRTAVSQRKSRERSRSAERRRSQSFDRNAN